MLKNWCENDFEIKSKSYTFLVLIHVWVSMMFIFGLCFVSFM